MSDRTCKCDNCGEYGYPSFVVNEDTEYALDFCSRKCIAEWAYKLHTGKELKLKD